jgi:hypothetical protein
MPLTKPSITPPESYVVRIYRRGPGARGRIAGTVEIVASGIERSFNGLRELQSILTRRAHATGNATPRDKPS